MGQRNARNGREKEGFSLLIARGAVVLRASAKQTPKELPDKVGDQRGQVVRTEATFFGLPDGRPRKHLVPHLVVILLEMNRRL